VFQRIGRFRLVLVGLFQFFLQRLDARAQVIQVFLFARVCRR
jgi:hypothetical protein